MSIAQPGLNVKLVTTHSGISVGEDGISHQAIEDLALACSLPGVTVIVPADGIETARAVRVAAQTFGPFYVRLGRPKVPVIYSPDYIFELGKASILRQGKDLSLIAIGTMVKAALDAAADLQKQGIECSVINMSTVQPIDEAAIVQAATETGAIVTAEEHLEHGGLSARVSQVVVKNKPVPMEFVTLKDYAMSGKPAELFARYGLTSQGIQEAAHKVLRRK